MPPRARRVTHHARRCALETPRARARRAIASLLVACALARGAAGAKSIDVALRAGWRATSFALETLVGVADVDGAAFWTLVDALDAPIDGRRER